MQNISIILQSSVSAYLILSPLEPKYNNLFDIQFYFINYFQKYYVYPLIH